MLSAIFKAVFCLLALVIGGGIIIWVGYNELVERQPQYRRPPFIGMFGIALVMLLTGLSWGRQAIAYFRKRPG